MDIPRPKPDIVRKLDAELAAAVSLENGPGGASAPLHAIGPSSTHKDPYMRMDYDGTTLFVSTILETQEKARKLIEAMTAMVPFLPKEPVP